MPKKIWFIFGCLLSFFYLSYCDAQIEVERAYYSNGQLQVETPYKDGKRHGVRKTYYENGQLWSQIPYKDGQEHGLKRTYYKNGTLSEERPYKEGKIHGLEKSYYDSGELYSQTPYEEGKQEGSEKYYYKNGQLSWEKRYVSGKLLEWKRYDQEGNLTEEKKLETKAISSLDEQEEAAPDEERFVPREAIYLEVDIDRARAVVEDWIEAFRKKDYQKISQLSTEVSSDLTRADDVISQYRRDKLEIYSLVLGDLEGYEYKTSQKKKVLRRLQSAELTYQIQFTNDFSQASFIVVNKRGETKIFNFSITPDTNEYRQIIKEKMAEVVEP